MGSFHWAFSPVSRLYRNIVKGVTLTKQQIIAARNAFLDARATDLATITDRLIDGDIDLATWERQMQRAIADDFTAEYALGRGGTDAMTTADKAALATLIAGQYGYLRGFAQDVAAGRLSADQIKARAALYGGAATQAHGRGQAAAWNVQLPCFPGEGTPCGSRCRCSWDIEDMGDEIDATWQTAGGNRVCEGCEERAADYSPLVFPKGVDVEADA